MRWRPVTVGDRRSVTFFAFFPVETIEDEQVRWLEKVRVVQARVFDPNTQHSYWQNIKFMPLPRKKC